MADIFIEQPEAERNYKDTVFRMVFKEKKELLSLYNAVNETNHKNVDELEITTLRNAISMNMKNDISCVIDCGMNLYEHQSTVNPNMPLRDLFYVARLYETLIVDKDIYSRKKIPLPTPKFITFYNGVEKQLERRVMKLSDSFEQKGEVNLELEVLQINLNPGNNTELMKACRTLSEYTIYVEKVRKYKAVMPLKDAVKCAVDECICENILADFLKKNRAEVIQLSIFEYDEELHNKTLREEGFERGIQGAIKILQKMNLPKNQIIESIMEEYQITEQEAKKYFE